MLKITLFQVPSKPVIPLTEVVKNISKNLNDSTVKTPQQQKHQQSSQNLNKQVKRVASSLSKNNKKRSSVSGASSVHAASAISTESPVSLSVSLSQRVPDSNLMPATPSTGVSAAINIR